MRKLAPWFVLFALCSVTAFAEQSDVLPNGFLTHMRSKHVDPPAAGTHATLKAHASLNSRDHHNSQPAFPPGIDTIVNFTGQFNAPGVYFDGTTRNTWQYSMVGNPPERGGLTFYNAPIVPVTMDLRNADGSPRYVVTTTSNCPTCTPQQLGRSVRLISRPDQFIKPLLFSPVFNLAKYSSSPFPTQIFDAEQRAEFGHHAREDWHTLLLPRLRHGQTMVLNAGSYYYSLNTDGSCCAYILASDPVFSSNLFPPSTPDNSTVMGAAEVAGDVTPQDISTFYFPNVYLYENNDPNQCCVLGYHSFDVEAGDAHNGNRTKFYVMNYSSWISPGLFGGGFQDVTAISHELAETFNDPFVGFDGIHNITPFWQNAAGQCQDLMEDGDVIEDLPNPTYPIKLAGYTYHPQTVALLPWFEFQSPSTALHMAYSYPDETVLTSLSAPQPLNCGQ